MPPQVPRIDHQALVSNLKVHNVGFISSKPVSFKDDRTGIDKVLHKTHFMTDSGDILTYWLDFPLVIEIHLPRVDVHLETKIKNEKFTDVVKDVIVL